MAAPKRSNHSGTASHAGVALSFTTKLPAQADFKKVLLERYQEAIARSRKIGHRVSFRVEVDPAAGAQTITPVEEQPSASDAFPVEDRGKPDAELEAALAKARECGRKRVAEIVAGEDMLSAEAFAKLLGTSRVTVNAKRQNGQVLG
ncbi:MAG: XRE family transcriptional regulator, partial [Mesorhizobium sp.]